MLQKATLFFFVSLLSLAATSQVYISKSIKDFGAKGNGRTNDQAAFEAAALFFTKRGGNGKLLIPKGVYIVGRQDVKAGTKGQNVLDISGCTNLTIKGNNAVIRFRDSLRFGAFDPATDKPFHTNQSVFTTFSFATPIGNFINMTDCQNIIITGIEIDGNQKGMILGGKFGDAGFQLSHDGIFIKDCSGVLLENLYIHHMGRDGVQLSNKTPDKWQTADQNIVIRKSRFEYNGRQGLSWVSGSGLKVSDCKFNFTGRGIFYSAPGAGVDIEAETGIVKNGIFENCEFIDNVGCGLVADSGESMDMQFNNCTFWGTVTWSMWTVKPNYNFNHCRFFGSIVHSYNSENDSNATKFVQCLFQDSSYNGKLAFGKYLVEINFRRRVLFDQCTFVSNTKKIWWFDGDPKWKDEEKPMLKNSVIVMKMTNFPDGDFISVKNCIREGGSTYTMYLPKSKKYYEAGGSGYVNLGNNKLVWKNTN